MRAALLLTVAAIGCGPAVTPPPVVDPEPPPPEPTPSFLSEQDVVPPAPARTDASEARPQPVFQLAHRSEFVDLRFSPTDDVVAVTSGDGTVSLMSPRTGEIRAARRVFIRPGGGMNALEFDASGSRLLLASGGREGGPGTLLVWDLHDDVLLSAEAPDFQSEAAIHPDGSRVITVGREASMDYYYEEPQGDGEEDPGEPSASLHVWSLSDGRVTPLAELEPGFVPTWIAISPSGRSLALHDAQIGAYQLRRMDGSRIVAVGDGEGGAHWSRPAYRPNGGAVAALSDAGRLEVRDPATGEIRLAVDPPDGAPEVHLAWSRDGSRLVLASDAGNVRVLDGRTGELVARYDVRAQDGLLVSGDGATLYTTTGGEAHRYDATSGADEGVIARDVYFAQMWLSPDGRTLAGSEGDVLSFVDTQTQAELARRETAWGEHSIWGMQWYPDGTGVTTWGRAGVELWDAAQGVRAVRCPGPGHMYWDGAGGMRFFVTGDYEAGVCDVASGDVRLVDQLATVSPDGSTYVALAGDEVALRNTDDGSQRTAFAEQDAAGLYSYAIARGARSVLGWSNDRVVLFNGVSGRARTTLGVESEVRGVFFAPDGQTFVVQHEQTGSLHASSNGRARLRFGTTGEPLRVAFSPDGRTFAYAVGRQITLAATATGRSLVALQTEGAPTEMRFSSDGRRLITHDGEGVLQLWDAADGGAAGRLAGVEPGFDVSADGAEVAWCEGGLVRTRPVAGGEPRTRGSCALSRGPVYSPDGRHIAVHGGTVVDLIPRGDGETLTLRKVHAESQAFLLAHDGRGRYVVTPGGAEHLRFRGAGAVGRATLEPIASHGATPDLLREALSAPAD